LNMMQNKRPLERKSQRKRNKVFKSQRMVNRAFHKAGSGTISNNYN
jgi:hypothetical protein